MPSGNSKKYLKAAKFAYSSLYRQKLRRRVYHFAKKEKLPNFGSVSLV